MRAVFAIAGASLCLALAGGCEDGSHVLNEKLERAPVIPKPPTARTSPVAEFDTPGTVLGFPPGSFGTGTSGLALSRKDLGESSSQGSLEEGDAVVCDPANHRVILLKARVRGTGTEATVFSSSAPGGDLDGASGVYIAEPTVATRRVIVSTSAGYVVLPDSGLPVTAHPITGGPFTAMTVFETTHTLFMVAGTTIRRVALESGDEFGPTNGAASDLLYSGSGAIGGLAEGLNGDLLFTEAGTLRRLPDAAAVPVPAPVVLTVMTFDAGEVGRGICIDSARNAVVAIDRTAVGTGAPGRLLEASLGVSNQTAADAVSSVTLSAAPQAVAIDGAHGAYTVAFRFSVQPYLESAPDLTERVQPVFNGRGCIGCHPVVNNVIDLTTPDNAFNSLVNQSVSASCSTTGASNVPPPASLYVTPGDPTASLLIQKVSGKRDGSFNAACGQRMPQNLRPILEVEVDTLRRWIASGAAR